MYLLLINSRFYDMCSTVVRPGFRDLRGRRLARIRRWRPRTCAQIHIQELNDRCIYYIGDEKVQSRRMIQFYPSVRTKLSNAGRVVDVTSK